MKPTRKSRRADNLITLIQITMKDSQTNDFVDTRRVTEQEATRIRKEAGRDVDGFMHVVDGSAIRHILDRHGADVSPMTSEDIARIPDITREAEIRDGGMSHQGLCRIIYRKPENGYLFVVEEVRTGRGKLCLVAAYKVQ